MSKIKYTVVLAAIIASNFLFFRPAFGAVELVKSKNFSTIYYVDSFNIRHTFPNAITYQSWYGADYSKVVTISDKLLASYKIGKNITVRPGTYLIKSQTAPTIYSVATGGVLQAIDNEEIAEAIYGKNWAKKVIDLPDSFFENYTIGSPILHDYNIPDGVLFYSTETKKYYYKNNDILQPFATTDAVKQNNFKLSDAVISGRSYYVRERPITGLNKAVFNLTAKPIVDTRDCENKNLKAAVIFLVNQEYSAAQIDLLQKIKNAIPARFSWATSNFSAIDFEQPTNIIFGDDYILGKRNDGSIEIKNEVVNGFYDNNPDIFDFVFIWTNFDIPQELNTNEIAHFTAVSNKMEGTGRNLLDASSSYGSTGKLKGVIVMGNINKYSADTSAALNEVLNVVMHEILHQWSAYAMFKNSDGKLDNSLLRTPDLAHWSYYDGFISPLGGSGWVDNGSGAYTSQLAQLPDSGLRQYSQLDLYLMGLIPYQLMPPVFYITPSQKGAMGNTIVGSAKSVSVDQIIAANGNVSCSK